MKDGVLRWKDLRWRLVLRMVDVVFRGKWRGVERMALGDWPFVAACVGAELLALSFHEGTLFNQLIMVQTYWALGTFWTLENYALHIKSITFVYQPLWLYHNLDVTPSANRSSEATSILYRCRSSRCPPSMLLLGKGLRLYLFLLSVNVPFNFLLLRVNKPLHPISQNIDFQAQFL